MPASTENRDATKRLLVSKSKSFFVLEPSRHAFRKTEAIRHLPEVGLMKRNMLIDGDAFSTPSLSCRCNLTSAYFRCSRLGSTRSILFRACCLFSRNEI